MKLVQLRIVAAGERGWASEPLPFGLPVTSLYAPNGSGKTPLIQSIVYCLGYPATFRQDIMNHCESAVLDVEFQGSIVSFTRKFSSEFQMRVVDPDGDELEFSSERQFSEWLFEALGMQFPALVGLDKKQTHPYASTVLPIFYVDQDLGYADVYKAPKGFIQDQAVEMVRLCFGLPPRHSYDLKGELLRAKEALGFLDRRVVDQQKIIADMGQRIDDREATRNELTERAGRVDAELAKLQDAVGARNGTSAAMEELREQRASAVGELRREVSALRNRLSGIAEIRSEIDSEIQTLSLNEESRRVFVSFQEICRNPDCGLLLGTSESYAKNLVYLKDQIKDLERNAERASARLGEMTTSLERQEAELTALVERIRQDANAGTAKQLVGAIQELTRQAYQLGQTIGAIDTLRAERGKLLKLENERGRVQDQIANLQAGGRADLEFNALRTRIQDKVAEWLDVLHAKNISRKVSIDLNFQFRFGDEPFAVFKGSTKARAILAIHAAIFEEYLSDESRPYRFLILDTPKQQDMQTGDIANFLRVLAEKCQALRGQVIFSSTEYHYDVGDSGKEWRPTFDGFEQLMYLGFPSQVQQ